MAEALPRVYLRDIKEPYQHFTVIGIVIAKGDPNYFLSKSNQFIGVLFLTIRDDFESIVNCKYINTEAAVVALAESINIGDLLVIKNPNVIEVPLVKSANELFRPMATLPFMLHVSDKRGEITKYHTDEDELSRELIQLEHMPVRPLKGALNLRDVYFKLMQNDSKGQCVDLLVVVGIVRTLGQYPRTRNDREVIQYYLDVILFDRSHTDGMLMTIWNREMIDRAQKHWKPHTTVLQLADVKLTYSNFLQTNKLSLGDRSLVVEDPIGRECAELQEFARKIKGEGFDITESTLPKNLPQRK